MKWEKYLQLCIEHPEIAQIVRWHATSAPTIDEEWMMNYVQQRLTYIAFRPFNTLDLSAKSVTFVENNDCNGIHGYWIYYTKKPNPVPQSRTTEVIVGTRTLQELIDTLGQEDVSFLWIVVHHHAINYRELTESSYIEIYPFPPGFSKKLPQEVPITSTVVS